MCSQLAAALLLLFVCGHVTCLLTQHKQLAATLHSFDVNDDGLLSILQLESALRSLHVTHKQLSGTAIRR
jgi:hypothetical protein